MTAIRMLPIVLSCLLLLVSCYRVPALPTESDPNNIRNDNTGSREKLNELTSYIDASNVYGSTQEEKDSLRTKTGDYSAMNREKRTVRLLLGRAVLQGIQAVKRMVKGARKVPSDNGVKEYEKTGGYKKASMDFEKAKPKDVQPLIGPSGVIGKTGKVGDREVILRDGGNGVRPTIEIIRPRDFKGNYVDQVTERITYSPR